MTSVEIGMIVIAALIPIVALVILFPFTRKKKEKPAPKSTVVEEIKSEPKPPVEEFVPSSDGLKTASLEEDDFLAYLKDKSSKVNKPERKEMEFNLGDIDDDIFSDMDFPRPRRKAKKEQTLSEQIQGLSPELKALILTGVLDRKDY